MEKIKAELLWDFSQDPPYEKTLYAVYSDAVTVTFDLTKTGSQLHNWTGPALSNVDHGYVFYQDPSNPRLVTYRMAVGELLPKPVDPSPNSGVSTWGFLSWVTVNSLSNTTTFANNGTYKSSLFNFDNPVSTNQTIYTSWTKGTPQEFTFNVENHVVNGNPDDTFTYNITVTDAEVWGKLEAEPSKNTAGPSDTDWGTFSVDTEWVKVPTIDHTGAEIKDPGRDGVYLDAHLADTSSIDLYPLFIEARWIDFTSGLSGSGATFVGSRYLEAWGAATTAQTPEEEGKNVASSLEISTRAGYNFGGWYAFAVMDQTTGEITNLTTPQDVTVTYIDSDYHTHSVTINTTAIPITDGTGAVIYDGTYALTTPDGSVDLFSATGGKLKLHDALDRLSLTAKWNPAPTDITIVYWLENALDDNFTASAIKALDTDQLSQGLSRAISSGSVLTLEDLKAFADPDTGICVVDRDILDEVGAVEKKVDPTAMTAREDIFFDLDETRSDVQTTINGDGSSVFNVYFKRKVFKLE